jgi:hypothetical protein
MKVMPAVKKEVVKWLPVSNKSAVAYMVTGTSAVLVSAIVVGTSPLVTSVVGVAAGCSAARLSNSPAVCAKASWLGGVLGTGAARVRNAFGK